MFYKDIDLIRKSGGIVLKWNKDYKLEILLSFLCAKWYVSSHYVSEAIGYFMFISIVAYPYIIYKLKCILNRKNKCFKVNLMFTIAIIVLILNSFLLIGISLFNILSHQKNFQYGYFVFVNITTILKSVVFIILGIILSRNIFEFKLPLNVFAFCNIAFGIETIFLAVIEISKYLNLFYYNYSSVVTKFMNYTNLAFQIMIFGSLAVIFINAGTFGEKLLRDDINAN